MTASWCFNEQQLERALKGLWSWQAWAVRRFLHSDLAKQHKLRVMPSVPSATPGLSPEGRYQRG